MSQENSNNNSLSQQHKSPSISNVGKENIPPTNSPSISQIDAMIQDPRFIRNQTRLDNLDLEAIDALDTNNNEIQSVNSVSHAGVDLASAAEENGAVSTASTVIFRDVNTETEKKNEEEADDIQNTTFELLQQDEPDLLLPEQFLDFTNSPSPPLTPTINNNINTPPPPPQQQQQPPLSPIVESTEQEVIIAREDEGKQHRPSQRLPTETPFSYDYSVDFNLNSQLSTATIIVDSLPPMSISYDKTAMVSKSSGAAGCCQGTLSQRTLKKENGEVVRRSSLSIMSSLTPPRPCDEVEPVILKKPPSSSGRTKVGGKISEVIEISSTETSPVVPSTKREPLNESSSDLELVEKKSTAACSKQLFFKGEEGDLGTGEEESRGLKLRNRTIAGFSNKLNNPLRRPHKKKAVQSAAVSSSSKKSLKTEPETPPLTSGQVLHEQAVDASDDVGGNADIVQPEIPKRSVEVPSEDQHSSSTSESVPPTGS